MLAWQLMQPLSCSVLPTLGSPLANGAAWAVRESSAAAEKTIRDFMAGFLGTMAGLWLQAVPSATPPGPGSMRKCALIQSGNPHGAQPHPSALARHGDDRPV